MLPFDAPGGLTPDRELSLPGVRLAALYLVSAAEDGELGNRGAEVVQLSSDGRWLAFSSYSSNLVAGDLNRERDVFVKDLSTGTLTLVSSTANGTAVGAFSVSGISDDGRYVCFASQSPALVAGDIGFGTDLFVKDLHTGVVVMASSAADGTPGNHASDRGSLSADGRFVALGSMAGNLVPGDTIAFPDVFVKDLGTGAIVMASSAADGTPANGTGSYAVTLSADGRYVAFDRDADNLVPEGGNGVAQVFVKDLHTGAIVLASRASDGTLGSAASSPQWISADGRYLVLNSFADNLIPGISGAQVYVRDLQTGAIVLGSSAADGTAAGGWGGALSADGRYLVFSSDADNLVPGDDNGYLDVFIKDLHTGAIGLLSGAPGSGPSDGHSYGSARISADGGFVVFESWATNLVDGDVNNSPDVFLAVLAVDRFVPGTSGPDTLQGGLGNDTFEPGDGDDELHGGAGIDTAILAGDFADFDWSLLITADSRSLTVSNRTSADADLLYDIEVLRFDDRSVDVEDLLKGRDTIRALFNERTGQTVYTADLEEQRQWMQDPDMAPLSFRIEAPLGTEDDVVPVHRVYSSVYDLYLWTASEALRDSILGEPGIGIEDQGIAFYAYADAASGGKMPIHMLWDWNPTATYAGASAPLNILYVDEPLLPFLDRAGDAVDDMGVQFWL